MGTVSCMHDKRIAQGLYEDGTHRFTIQAQPDDIESMKDQVDIVASLICDGCFSAKLEIIPVADFQLE